MSNCQRRTSEAVRSPRVRGADGCELSSMVLEIQLKSLKRGATALN